MTLRAPFPWFGGKSRAASIIWERFGDPANYIEPFAGSLAVLLARPTRPRIETVNDLDCNVANFWRAVKADPEAVAKFADWPVNEADLHARHRWLVAQLPALPDSWECVPWKARKGYGAVDENGRNENRERERIWFSPHCLKPDKGQIAMFGAS